MKSQKELESISKKKGGFVPPSINVVSATGKPYIRLYSTGSLMIYSLVVIVSIMLLSYRMKKNATEKLPRAGAALLFYSTIAMLAFFVFFIIENALIVFIAIEGYSIFMYLAWISAMFFYILSYLSLVMPNWLVKRIQEK